MGYAGYKYKVDSSLRFAMTVLLAGMAGAVGAQEQPAVRAVFGRDTVMMGDQFEMEIRVEKDLMQVVGFPEFAGATQPEAVEILEEFPVDTLAVDGRRQTLVKRYRVTVWEPGRYNLGRVPALLVDKNRVDTLWAADSLRIVVTGFQIDPSKDKPFDIKPPVGVGFRFGEVAGWLLAAIGMLGLLGGAGWLVWRFRRRVMRALGVGPAPELPPHEEAIRRLEALRNQKLPQNGKLKQYYSGLTDILRAYLDGRWGIGALEMTSAEIVAAVKAGPAAAGEVDAKRFDNLTELLEVGDLVKFAKFAPLQDEVDAAWFKAYYFVEETKVVANE